MACDMAAANEHSGYPLKWFKDQKAARHAFECAICLEILKDPVQIRDCGHQFCVLCIDDILKTDPRCPSCRMEISDAMIFEDHAARRLIRRLYVNCCNKGCSWVGCLSSLLQDHQNSCNFFIQSGNNVHQLHVEKLEQKLETLLVRVSSLEMKHQVEQDMKELTFKHEQDIEKLKLKLTLQFENDLKQAKSKTQLLKSLLDDSNAAKEQLKSETRELNQRNMKLESELEEKENELHQKYMDLLQKLKDAKDEWQKEKTYMGSYEPRTNATAENVNELEDLLRKKDQEMKAMESKYKEYLEKAKSVIKTLNLNQNGPGSAP